MENNTKISSKLLSELYSETGSAYRIGITGPPGAGKSSLTDKLIQNFKAILETLEREKSNNTVKGNLIKNIFLTSTMGVSYKLKIPKSI